MKKCPYCKADIEDNARFCLYCMKPLTEKEIIQQKKEKKHWWILALVGVMSLSLILVSVLLVVKGQKAKSVTVTGNNTASNTEPYQTQPTESLDGEVEPSSNSEKQDENIDRSDNAVTVGNQDKPTSDSDASKVTPSQTPNSNTSAPKQEQESTAPATATPSTTTPPKGTTSPTTSQPNNTAPSTGKPTQPAEATTKPKDTSTQAVYSYRTARAGDDFDANYTNSGNDIVITGVVTPSSNGVYDLPSYIDGKRVIAITANAFSGAGNNVKTVYVPTTIRTIWSNAFNGCSVKDIYFTHNIYIEEVPSGVTVHCPRDCHNRAYRYYRSAASYYGYNYEEWNG